MKNAITRWTLAAVAAASMGFGATQALASPAEAADAAVCDVVKCRANCKAQGQTSGACFEGQCICYIT